MSPVDFLQVILLLRTGFCAIFEFEFEDPLIPLPETWQNHFSKNCPPRVDFQIFYFDLYCNKTVRLGRCIFKQNRGTAQGGYISSEIACLYVESRENDLSNSNQILNSPVISRFRDNINIFAPLDDPIWEDTKEKLKSIYRLPIKREHSIVSPVSDELHTNKFK